MRQLLGSIRIFMATALSLAGVAALGYAEYYFARMQYPMYVFYLIALLPVSLAAPRLLALLIAPLTAAAKYCGYYYSGVQFTDPNYIYFHIAALGLTGLIFAWVVSGMSAGTVLRWRIRGRDLLTGLMNHRSFLQRLGSEIRKSHRGMRPLCLAYIDCENLPELNGRNGFSAGDNALRFVGGIIRENMRMRDFVGRMSGDEFAVCLPGTTWKKANAHLRRIREELTWHVPRAGFSISFYLGACTFDVAPRFPSGMMKQVMKTVRMAKQKQKNTLVHVRVKPNELREAERADRI